MHCKCPLPKLVAFRCMFCFSCYSICRMSRNLDGSVAFATKILSAALQVSHSHHRPVAQKGRITKLLAICRWAVHRSSFKPC